MKARLPQGMGGGPQNMQAMMQQARKMQEQMEQTRAALEAREYEIASGGGISGSALCDYLSQVGLCARDYLDREEYVRFRHGEEQFGRHRIDREKHFTLCYDGGKSRRAAFRTLDRFVKPGAGMIIQSHIRLTAARIFGKRKLSLLRFLHKTF